MAYSNIDMGELITHSLRRQFTPNMVVVNPSIVNTKLKWFSAQTVITLNPTSSSEVISYIRNLEKVKLPSLSCICSIPYIFNLTSIFFLISNCMQNLCMFLHCWKNSLFIYPNQGKIDKPLLALDLFINYLAHLRYITFYLRSI